MRSIKTEHVFYNGNENPINAGNLLRSFYLSVKKAGLKALRFHDLRHPSATRLVQAGVDLYTVQNVGPWKTLSMVTRYAHHHPESLRPGVEALEKGKKFITNSAVQHCPTKVCCNDPHRQGGD